MNGNAIDVGDSPLLGAPVATVHGRRTLDDICNAPTSSRTTLPDFPRERVDGDGYDPLLSVYTTLLGTSDPWVRDCLSYWAGWTARKEFRRNKCAVCRDALFASEYWSDETFKLQAIKVWD